MAILRLKNEKGEWIEIPALIGPKGDKGDAGYTPQKGVDYFDGEPGKTGTSVTVSNVSESTVDGGNNVVTFSDGTTVTIKNGSKGSDGKNGSDASVTSENIVSALGYTPANPSKVAPSYSYGTSDLTAGTSTLETGKLHFVYE